MQEYQIVKNVNFSQIFPLLKNSKKLAFQKDASHGFWVIAYQNQNIFWKWNPMTNLWKHFSSGISPSKELCDYWDSSNQRQLSHRSNTYVYTVSHSSLTLKTSITAPPSGGLLLDQGSRRRSPYLEPRLSPVGASDIGLISFNHKYLKTETK